MYFFFFFLGFEGLAPFLLIIFRILNNDFAYFFKFYSIVLVSFGMATSVVSNQFNDCAGYGLGHMFLAMWSLLQNTVGINSTGNETSLDSAYDGLEWLMDVYITSFYVFVVLLLVNLLIGMIGNTYASYSKSQKGLLLMEQYNIVCSMERGLAEKDKKVLLSKFTNDNQLGTNFKFFNPQFQCQQLDKDWYNNAESAERYILSWNLVNAHMKHVF